IAAEGWTNRGWTPLRPMGPRPASCQCGSRIRRSLPPALLSRSEVIAALLTTDVQAVWWPAQPSSLQLVLGNGCTSTAGPRVRPGPVGPGPATILSAGGAAMAPARGGQRIAVPCAVRLCGQPFTVSGPA